MEMFQYDFIQRAFTAGLGISFMSPILGMFLILRGQSMMADTLAHVSLAGVAIGVLLKVNPTYTTLIVLIIAAFIVEYLRNVYSDYADTSIALLMSGGMALALVLTSANTNTANFKIDQYLFGSLLLVTEEQVKVILLLAVVIVALYIIFRRPLYVLTYEEDTAYTSGLPVKLMSLIFSAITGVVIGIMMPIVGSLLVSALIVIPAATSIRISKSFEQTIFWGVIINLVGIFLGIASSFYFDTPPGASITLWFIIIFLVVVFFDWLKGKITRKKQSEE